MPSPLERLRELFETTLSASEVADLFLSPHVDPRLLRDSTAEPGPAMWIVNRSDVYDETLDAMQTHAWEEMATRARAKLRQRRGETLSLLEPFELDGPVEEIPDYAVEDVLGHPLAPFEAMLFFAKAIAEDVRGSSALSLTRRLLEHPPNWDFDPLMRQRLVERFSYNLLEDASPYVRAYSARVPILPASQIRWALERETHPLVLGRLFQSPAFDAENFGLAATKALGADSAFPSRVLSADRRLPTELRRQLANSNDEITRSFSEWYLSN
mgnify:CR=1 FL=1